MREEALSQVSVDGQECLYLFYVSFVLGEVQELYSSSRDMVCVMVNVLHSLTGHVWLTIISSDALD